MKQILRIAALVASVAIAAPANVRADDSTFQAFGGLPGLTKIVDDFVATVVADKRIGSFFVNADLPRLRMRLTEQFCVLLEGPCTYGGLDMESAHKGMGLKDASFNALAEDLQFAMDRAGIPFRTQNILIAKLASMEKQITYR